MSEHIKMFAALLSFIGVPSIFAISSWCVKACAKFKNDLDVLQAAQKAQMRSQLIKQYHEYREVVKNGGMIAEEDILDWCNQHKAYHNLVGDNGVLEARKRDLLTFPTYVRN